MNWTSDKIDQIAPALLKAQIAMKGAKKDSVNPGLKSKYADLGSVFEACKKPLNDNGIAIIQGIGNKDGRNTMQTVFIHESGQCIGDESFLPEIETNRGVNAAQGMGSVITYMRRYQLSAMAGVLQEDDDGNAAGSAEPAEPPITFDELCKKITDAKAIPHLANLWKKHEAAMGNMSEQEKKDLVIMKDSKKAALQAAMDAGKGEG